MARERAEEAPPRLLSVGAAAQRLGLHRSTLHLAIRRGLITPDLTTAGGHARFTPSTLDAYAERLAQAPATSIGASVAGAQLSNRAQLLERLARTLTASRPTDEPLRESLREVQRVFPQFASLGVVTPRPTLGAGPTYRIAAQLGVAPAVVERFQQLYGQVSLTVPRVLATGEPVYLEDVTRILPPTAGTASLLRLAGHRAYAVTPLIQGSQIVGAFGVSSPEAYEFTPYVRETLEDVSAELALLLRYDEQRERQRGWLQAVSEYIASCAAGAPVSARGSDGEAPLARLGQAFLELYAAHDLFVHGPGLSLSPRSKPLRAVATLLGGERPLVVESWIDEGGMLTGVGLRVGMGERVICLGALWRGDEHPPVEHYQGALVTLAGVCAMSTTVDRPGAVRAEAVYDKDA